MHPYHLACIENHWYLFAYDVNRQAIRTFSVSRLADPKLGDQRFVVPKDFNPDEYLRGSFSVFKGKGDYEVVIEFDAWATDLVCGFYFEQAASQRWSKRELQSQIDRALFERVALSRDTGALVRLEKQRGPVETVRYEDAFKDPYLLDFLGLKGAYSEKDLEAAILVSRGRRRQHLETDPVTNI